MHIKTLGLDGKWATWANRKYHGHHVLPDTLWDDLEEEKKRRIKCIMILIQFLTISTT